MRSKDSIQTKLSKKPVDEGHALPQRHGVGVFRPSVGSVRSGEWVRAGNTVSRVGPKACSGLVRRHVTQAVPRVLCGRESR